MLVWIDHYIFGNGYGLAAPSSDEAYLWLKDAYTNKSELYTFSGWFGSQLVSFQWTHPLPGERRKLSNREFLVQTSERRGFRVRVSWGMVDVCRTKDIDESHSIINSLKNELHKLI